MTTPCKRCEKSGLPILLVRPSAVATDAAFAPPGSAALATHQGTVGAFGLPALKKSKHILRLLRREGFVYVYYPDAKPGGMIKPWEVYKVHDKGALMPQGEFVFEKSEFACDKKITHPHDVRTICIREPEVVKKVWIGFSMNWWSDKIKGEVIGNLKAAGMVQVNLLAGPPTNGFKAEAGLIQQHVADYAIQQMTHAGVDSATPLWPAGSVAPSQAAQAMAEVMKKQAAGSPITKDKQMVVALPDPVGLAADLNGIRIARDKVNKDEWLKNEDWKRSEACYQTLEGLRKSILASEMIQSTNRWTRASQKQWEDQKARSLPPGPPFIWTPDPAGGYANDGSANGRLTAIGPDADRLNSRGPRNGVLGGKRRWNHIRDQLKTAKFDAWPATRDAIVLRQAKELRPYETDWLGALTYAKFLPYFAQHFDDNDAGLQTAPVCCGFVYANEADIAYHPQPQVHEDDFDQWLQLTIDLDITDPRAVALRAMFANQKSVIDKFRALLVGKADRSEGDMRDKTVDLLRGVLTHELGARFNWLHPRVMALSAGGLASMAAGTFQLMAILAGKNKAPPSLRIAKWQATLAPLSLAQQAVEQALQAITLPGKGTLLLPVLLVADVNAVDFLQFMRDSPLSAAEKRGAIDRVQDTTAKRFKVMVLTDAPTAISVQKGEVSLSRVAGQRAGVLDTRKAKRSVQSLELQASAMGAQRITGEQVKQVIERQHIRSELGATSVEGRLAIGAGIVQAIGLFQSIKQLTSEWDKLYRDDAKFREALLGTLDGTGGLVGAMAEVAAAQYKSALIPQHSAEKLIEASTRLATLRSVSAITGVAGGVIGVMLMAGKAEEAKGKGDTGAYQSYSLASVLFVGTSVTSTFALADAAAAGIASRVVVSILIRTLGVVATEASVASAISGVGLVILAIVIAAIVAANLLERDSLERWAGGCYFGSDSDPKLHYKTAMQEAAALDAVFWEAENEREQGKLGRLHPMPPGAPGILDPANATVENGD